MLPLPDFEAVGTLVMEGIYTLIAQRATMVRQEGALARALEATNERTEAFAMQVHGVSGTA